MIPSLLFLLAGWYLLVAVPLFFCAALCLFLFSTVFADARRSVRGMSFSLLLFSAGHLVLARFIFEAASQSPWTGWEVFWAASLFGTPVLSVITALLPLPDGSHSALPDPAEEGDRPAR